ncbi:MAG: endonuclease/exonuclease/phosphatase family protein [Thermoleophilia bacterium]
MPRPVRILTWNVFHCRDSGGREAEGLTHLNRKHTAEVAALLAEAGADAVMLQEVPPLAVPALAAGAGAARGWTVLTGPHVGGVRLRGRLGAAAPDLWKTHEGNANVLLLGPRLRPAGPARALRLNPSREVLAQALRRRDRNPREIRRWLSEPRRAVAVDAALPDGTVCTFACAHLHGARVPWHRELELRRLAAWLGAGGGPVVLGGDLNAGPADPLMALLHDAGLGGPPADRRVGIDRILVRGLRVVAPERVWDPARRRARVGGAEVEVSDHDPVECEVAGP